MPTDEWRPSTCDPLSDELRAAIEGGLASEGGQVGLMDAVVMRQHVSDLDIWHHVIAGWITGPELPPTKAIWVWSENHPDIPADDAISSYNDAAADNSSFPMRYSRLRLHVRMQGNTVQIALECLDQP